jgi:hypothetical protein
MIRAMSDPVGYVESHGGVQGFLARTLTPSTAPLPPARLTPSPLTPIPGMYTPAPGTLTHNTGHPTGHPTGVGNAQSPTTLSSAAGQVAQGRSKTGFVIAGVLVVGAAIAGVAVVLGGSKKTENAGGGSGSDVAVTGSADTGSGSAMTVAHGSAAVVTNTGTGSASVTTTGSAAGSAVVTNTGSGAGSAAVTTNTGSASGSGAGSSVVTPAPLASLALTSTPDGADIYINGAPTGKKTPATLQLPRAAKVTIGLRLKGYDDLFIKEVALDSDQITKDAALKKSHSSSGTTGTGKGSAHGTGKGSAKACDTCLERPD